MNNSKGANTAQTEEDKLLAAGEASLALAQEILAKAGSGLDADFAPFDKAKKKADADESEEGDDTDPDGDGDDDSSPETDIDGDGGEGDDTEEEGDEPDLAQASTGMVKKKKPFAPAEAPAEAPMAKGADEGEFFDATPLLVSLEARLVNVEGLLKKAVDQNAEFLVIAKAQQAALGSFAKAQGARGDQPLMSKADQAQRVSVPTKIAKKAFDGETFMAKAYDIASAGELAMLESAIQQPDFAPEQLEELVSPETWVALNGGN